MIHGTQAFGSRDCDRVRGNRCGARRQQRHQQRRSLRLAGLCRHRPAVLRVLWQQPHLERQVHAAVSKRLYRTHSVGRRFRFVFPGEGLQPVPSAGQPGRNAATARRAESGSGGRLVSPGAGPKQQFVHLLPEWQPGLSGLRGSGRFRSAEWHAASRSTRKWRHGQPSRNPALRVRRRCRDFQEGTDRRRDHESRAESAVDRGRDRSIRRLHVRCDNTRRRSPAARVVEAGELSHRHARCTVSRSSGVHRSRLRGSEQRGRCRLVATAVSAGGHAAAISGR